MRLVGSEMCIRDRLITAQEILVCNASYPSPEIARNSEAFRPLGLGYTNLGAMLMARGIAYDSVNGRAIAGAVAAVMTGEAYAQSARIAQRVGPFSEFQSNRKPFPSNTFQSRPIQSRPIQSRPTQSNAIQTTPIQSNPPSPRKI